MKKLVFFLALLQACLAMPAIAAHRTSVVGYRACVSVNADNMVIKSASCGTKDGSVTGVVIEGDGRFTPVWKEANGAIAGRSLDLLNVQEGKYTLEISSEGCDKKTITITIDEKDGIYVNTQNVVYTPAGCDDKGSVLGLKITGATRYEWRSFSTGIIASTTDQLINAASGLYKLTAYNDAGCAKDAGTYFVTSKTTMPLVEKVEVVDPYCGKPKGDVTIELTVLPTQEDLVWVIRDSRSVLVKDGIIVFTPNAQFKITLDFAPGPYRMYVKGKDGCEIYLTQFRIAPNVLSLVSDSIGVVNDQCNQKKGRILGIQIKGQSPPFPNRPHYKWTDSSGKPVGDDHAYLLNVGAGKYTMLMIDGNGCELTASFTVLDESPDMVLPEALNVDLCLLGNASLIVANVDTAGSYKLYGSDAESIFLISKSKDGKFSVPVKHTSTFYISYLQGICESARTEVTVRIAAPGLIIPNTFTPNGDGINDVWNIEAIENFPGATIQVYSRYGSIVYSSRDYTKPFDGKRNGRDLPNGTYFYKIEIPEIFCKGKINGSLAILK